jgi:hypothetical protein
MPDPRRALILAALLAVGTALWVAQPARASRGDVAPDESVYAVSGWSAGPATTTTDHGVTFRTRRYLSTEGIGGVVAVATSPDAKKIYRAGSDVPFIGAGYSVESAPASMFPARGDRTVLLAKRGDETLLVIAGFGERRGTLGKGFASWTWAVLDAAIGSPNTYYAVTVVVPMSAKDSLPVRADELSRSVLAAVSRWYGTQTASKSD